MATRLATLVGFRQTTSRSSAEGQRESKFLQSQGQTLRYRQVEKHTKSETPCQGHRASANTSKNPWKVKLWRSKRGHRRRDHRHLAGSWYLAPSLSSIARKARAFCDRFCCDASENPITSAKEVVLVDPYFSIPVFPATASAPSF
ncbi:uncharacterized protein LOC131155633 [Malania oleifera]|uniref:uncharacterized protein LOC131155633 n=1 Tax=Malania oleifera TaxID=397392 RepID=UPI0025ADF2A0|nr:uncharacterized protein LOC131155633 [Malania oleifera]